MPKKRRKYDQWGYWHLFTPLPDFDILEKNMFSNRRRHMEIRRAQPSDRKAVMALVAAVSEGDYIPYCWDDWVDDTATGISLVARLDHRLVGIAHVHFLSKRVAWFQALRVLPTARRMGVGKALSQACLDYSARAGRQVARLLIDIDNHASRSLTAQAGFSMIAEWLRLEKATGPVSAPDIEPPKQEQLPRLVELAQANGVNLWHTDWETYDLDVEALSISLRNGTLHVLADSPTATMLDISYDEEDEEYRAYNPVGEPMAVSQIVQAMESAAYERGLPRIAVLLAADSPHLPTLQQLGFEFAVINTGNGDSMIDGVTIWEYT
jgi:GNAT superfamily N-acetyltransferase